MTEDLRIAPTPVLIRCLALLRRALIVIRDYGRARDRAGMEFGADLADAIHNVPGILIRHNPKGWWKPDEIEEWVFARYPRKVRALGAPDHVIAACARVVSTEGAAEELGLRADLSDLDLAPPDKLARYLGKVHELCLALRVTFRAPVERPANAKVSAEVWAEKMAATALLGTLEADALSTVLPALVHWGSFDEAQFLREALEMGNALPEKERATWRESFEKGPNPSR